MINVPFATAICLVVGVVMTRVMGMRRNFATAQASGFPTFYSPVHITETWWLMIYTFIVPVLKLLPHAWIHPWLPMSQVWQIWKVGHRPFEEVGSHTFTVSSPKGNILWTCEPFIIKQLFTQHGKAHVPVEFVKFFDLFGPTIGSVEGEEWKAHRKVITPGFNADTNKAVWRESLHQAAGLLYLWIEEGSVVPVVRPSLSRLVLHVSSGVIFNKKLKWKKGSDEEIPSGHHLSFQDAIITVVARLGTLFAVPKTLLGSLPSKFFQEAHLALTEWTKYMQELCDDTVEDLDGIKAKTNKSILESIVTAGTATQSHPGEVSIPRESVLGNIFFVFLGGHETTTSTIAFTVLLLAIYPNVQRRVQEELDKQLRSRPQPEWSVESDYPALLRGYLGAAIKETMRLYCPVQFTWRKTVSPTPGIDPEGERHVIPPNTLTALDFSATFRDPQLWPPSDVSATRRAELHDSPALDFDPERWFGRDDEDADRSDKAIPTHFPFGQGPRSCIGRAYAQIEMIGVLAATYKEYSLELEVDEKTLRAHEGDKNRAWNAVRDKAIRMLGDDVEANLNIMFMKELPIRIIKRRG